MSTAVENLENSTALTILKTSKTIKERAEVYYTSIKRNLQKSVLDSLIDKKEAIEDKIFFLKDFTLDTNHNEGRIDISKENAEKRFKDLIEAEYELELLNREIEIKQKVYNKYFKAENQENKSL